MDSPGTATGGSMKGARSTAATLIELPDKVTDRFRRALHSGIFLLVTILSLTEASAGDVSIRGVVRNASTGDPLDRVRIVVAPADGSSVQVTFSGGDGRFAFESLPSGFSELTASTVGYGFVKKSIELAGEGSYEVEIFLAPGTMITEEMTVSARLDRDPSQLSAAEVNQLKSVLMDDPFRALKQLPSLASGDDFNSTFAVQGSGFDRVAVMLDGIPVYSFLHTAEGLSDTGSTTLLSADLLDGTSLQLPGSSSVWSGTSAGYLGLQSRTGNSDRLRSLVTVSGSAFLATAEGPAGRGSWIAAGRKSYIDWIVRKIDPESSLNFGFYDLFGKIAYPLSDSHQLVVSGFHGNTGLHDVVEGTAINSVENGRYISDVVHLEWDGVYTSRLSSSTHFYVQANDSRNRNSLDQELWQNSENVTGVRSSWDLKATGALSVVFGGSAERWSVSSARYYYPPDAGFTTAGLGFPARRTIDAGGSEAVLMHASPYSSDGRITWSDFDVDRNRGSLFGEAKVNLGSRVVLGGGWAFDKQSGLREGFSTPTASIRIVPAGSQFILASWGEGGQMPFFNQLFDVFGNPYLTPERARNFNVLWDSGSREGMGISLSGFIRRRSAVPWRPDGLWRLVDDAITPPTIAPYENVLEDRSHGAEIRLRREASNGFSGWAGYAWGVSRWTESPGRAFPGNYDQRHGIGLYGHYRWSTALELSVKWRWATGLPIPAYARKVGDLYYLAGARNQERLPDYSRLDFRLGKSFDRDRFRMTLFVEVLNLLNRDNVRFAGHDIDSVNPVTGRIHGLVQTQIPILPTAGLTIEF